MDNCPKSVKVATKKWTQEKLAAAFGVGRVTMTDWLDTSNAGTGKACTDARILIPKSDRPEIINRIDSGETQKQIAVDYGTTRERIGQIVRQEKAREENKREQNEIASKKVEGTFNGVYDVIVIDKDTKAARKQRIFDLWLAGWTNKEAADAVGVPKGTVDALCLEMADLPNLSKLEQNAANHETLICGWRVGYK